MADYIKREDIEQVLMSYMKRKSFDKSIVQEIMQELDRLLEKSTDSTDAISN